MPGESRLLDKNGFFGYNIKVIFVFFGENRWRIFPSEKKEV